MSRFGFGFMRLVRVLSEYALCALFDALPLVYLALCVLGAVWLLVVSCVSK